MGAMTESESPLCFCYPALRREVLRQIPALEALIDEEEEATKMHVEPASSYQLVEDFVWREMRRAAVQGADAVRPYGRLIAAMLERGDESVRALAGIGLLEQIAHDRVARAAFVSAGFSYLLDELG
jgi:hypothetical protein